MMVSLGIIFQSIKNIVDDISSNDLNEFIKDNKKEIEQWTTYFRNVKL